MSYHKYVATKTEQGKQSRVSPDISFYSAYDDFQPDYNTVQLRIFLLVCNLKSS